MKIKISLILCLLIFNKVNSQFSKNNYFKENNKNYDTLIRSQINGVLGDSYFVITYPLLAATTSWVPQFLSIYEKIKNLDKEIVIVFYTNGGLRSKDIPLFMNEMFNINQKDQAKIKIITNDNLFQILNEGRELPRLQYYFRRNLFYNEDEKWHKLNPYILPSEHLKITKENSIVLKNIDSLLIFEVNKTYPFKKDKVLILTDAKNQLVMFDLKTGENSIILDLLKEYDASDLYCKYISKNTDQCNFAKQNAYKAINTKRKVFKIDGVVSDSNNLYLFVNIEVFEKSTDNYKFVNDLGNQENFEKGTPSLNVHSFIFKYDLKTKKITEHLFYDIKDYKGSEFYSMLEYGCYLDKDTLYTINIRYNKNNTTDFSLTKVTPCGNNYCANLVKPLKIKNNLATQYHHKNFIFLFNNQVLFTPNFSPNLYTISREAPQSSFIGNGYKPYSIEDPKKYSEDTLEDKINFLFDEIKSIQNNYILSFGYFKGMPYFELKNRMLQTIDLIDAEKIKGFEEYLKCSYRNDILIFDDKLVFKSIKADGEMYFDIFKIDINY